MAEVRYRYRAQDTDDWSKPLNLWTFIRAVKRRARRHGGPYRLKKRDGEWGSQLTLQQLGDSLKRRLSGGEVGDVFFVETRDGTVLHLRIVDAKPDVMNTVGTPAIDLIYTEVLTLWPSVQSWGICNCRHISGTNVWSYHAWCQAWDIHASVALMDDIAAYLNKNKTRLRILHVLWRVPDHFDHIHVDVEPVRTGQVPPCSS